MWCAMKLARGLKIVRSMPRSSIFFSWLDSIDSRSSSSLIFSVEATACLARILRGRDLQVAPGAERGRRGRVVAVDVDDHRKSLRRSAKESAASRRCALVMPWRRLIAAAAGEAHEGEQRRAASAGPSGRRRRRTKVVTISSAGRHRADQQLDAVEVVVQLAQLLEAEVGLAARKQARPRACRAVPAQGGSRKRSAMPQRSKSCLQAPAARPGRVGDRGRGRGPRGAGRLRSRSSGRGQPRGRRSRRASAAIARRLSVTTRPAAASSSIASAASTTRSKRSPARTRRVASTPPTDSNRAGRRRARCQASAEIGQQLAGRHRRDPGGRRSRAELRSLADGTDASGGLGVPVSLPASLPATEYSAPGALRVFWNSSSDCAAHGGVDVQVRHADHRAELLEHEEDRRRSGSGRASRAGATRSRSSSVRPAALERRPPASARKRARCSGSTRPCRNLLSAVGARRCARA